MSRFTDTITIRVRAGKGGSGAVSFHREKYIPKGGPDGGDGGKGGDVYIEASIRYASLSHLFDDRVYRAENGQKGSGNNKHGRDGKDLSVRVPLGTQVIDAQSCALLCDLLSDGDRFLCANGGVGGRGNSFFKSSVNQTPRISQPGIEGDERLLTLNLKLIADIGLVGLPNAGKSTLLSALTNARPKIAEYPFTTLIPNLGTVHREDGSFYTIADIPGIIENAHRGQGLGLSFLRHIERVKVMLFMIDATNDDPQYVLKLLRHELAEYSRDLLDKPYYILISKADLVDEKTLLKRVDLTGDSRIITVSSHTGHNIKRLLEILEVLLEEQIAPQGTSS